MKKLAALHMRLAVLYVIAGMLLGLYMGISEDHTQHSTHAHLNLAGFVVTFLYGLFFDRHANEAAGLLERGQFVLAHVGVVVMNIGVAVKYARDPELGERFAAPGSIAVFAGMLLFALIVYRRTRPAGRPSAGGVIRRSPALRP